MLHINKRPYLTLLFLRMEIFFHKTVRYRNVLYYTVLLLEYFFFFFPFLTKIRPGPYSTDTVPYGSHSTSTSIDHHMTSVERNIAANVPCSYRTVHTHEKNYLKFYNTGIVVIQIVM